MDGGGWGGVLYPEEGVDKPGRQNWLEPTCQPLLGPPVSLAGTKLTLPPALQNTAAAPKCWSPPWCPWAWCWPRGLWRSGWSEPGTGRMSVSPWALPARCPQPPAPRGLLRSILSHPLRGKVQAKGGGGRPTHMCPKLPLGAAVQMPSLEAHLQSLGF